MDTKTIKAKRFKRTLRKERVFKRVSQGGKPRLCVRRTLKHIYAQIIDDAKQSTVAAAWDGEVDVKKKKPVEVAKEVGTLVAKKSIEKGVKVVVFDRGSAKYHGRIKAAAEGAREAGLKF
ncbi:MAG: 50S ribosomal protein L18 [Candidatus Falkowbacteria bacterium]